MVNCVVVEITGKISMTFPYFREFACLARATRERVNDACKIQHVLARLKTERDCFVHMWELFNAQNIVQSAVAGTYSVSFNNVSAGREGRGGV